MNREWKLNERKNQQTENIYKIDNIQMKDEFPNIENDITTISNNHQ